MSFGKTIELFLVNGTADIVLGSYVSGLDYWKTKDGVSIKELDK